MVCAHTGFRFEFIRETYVISLNWRFIGAGSGVFNIRFGTIIQFSTPNEFIKIS